MYIKLGSTKLNYLKQAPDDFVILSQVVNSSSSYERPVLVRTTQELDIWFGKEFKEYNYFCELLESGVTLYLYRPVSKEQSYEGLEDIIDYRNFPYYIYEDSVNKKTIEEFQSIESLEFFINISSLKDSNGNVKYKFTISGEDYLYLNKEFVKISELQQNQVPNNTVSLNNRDTLLIGDNGNSFISPQYKQDVSGRGIFSFQEVDIDWKENSPEINNFGTEVYKKISENYQTLAFNLEFGNNFFSPRQNDFQFLVIDNKKLLIFHNGISKDVVENSSKYKNLEKLFSDISFFVTSDDYRSLIISEFEKFGYIIYEENDNNIILVANEPKGVNYFYDLDNFMITPNQELTYGILSKELAEKTVISFVSKTTGTLEEQDGGKIKVRIENLGNKLYRFFITRFNLEEMYEGTLSNIEVSIRESSKLVYCEIFNKDADITIITGYSEDGLPITQNYGEWFLIGGKKENNGVDGYWKALDSLINPPETVYFDYLLIPNPRVYKNDLGEIDYERLLDINKESEIDYQCLIQCSDYDIINVEELPKIGEKYTIYKITDKDYIYSNGVFQEILTENAILNDFTENYIDDRDNRLIYFYKSISVFRNERPGYYLYLSDLLVYDRYSPSTSNVLYDTPQNKKADFYEDNNLEKELEKKKCNYLVENNQLYYYKKYQNGTSYNTTGWMRFCLGKIKRELIKNKWRIIESSDISKIQKEIIAVLGRITSTFSIIRKIEISSFAVSFREQTIDLTIDTYISDLVNNNVSIEITLNYNT